LRLENMPFNRYKGLIPEAWGKALFVILIPSTMNRLEIEEGGYFCRSNLSGGKDKD
jgi:hypothetical protein